MEDGRNQSQRRKEFFVAPGKLVIAMETKWKNVKYRVT